MSVSQPSMMSRHHLMRQSCHILYMAPSGVLKLPVTIGSAIVSLTNELPYLNSNLFLGMAISNQEMEVLIRLHPTAERMESSGSLGLSQVQDVGQTWMQSDTEYSEESQQPRSQTTSQENSFNTDEDLESLADWLRRHDSANSGWST